MQNEEDWSYLGNEWLNSLSKIQTKFKYFFKVQKHIVIILKWYILFYFH